MFCKYKCLNYHIMRSILSGQRKDIWSGNFTVKYADEKFNKKPEELRVIRKEKGYVPSGKNHYNVNVYRFISPLGIEYIKLEGLKRACNDLGLPFSTIYKLVHGLSKTHRGGWNVKRIRGDQGITFTGRRMDTPCRYRLEAGN